MFTLAPQAAHVTASAARRRLSGLAVPWGVTATVTSGQRVRFERDSILLPEPASHVPLLADHDSTQAAGYLAEAVSTHQGLAVAFQLGTGPQGDASLRDGLEGVRTGLSVGVDPADPDRPPHQEPDGTLVFTQDRPALLREVSHLAIPAYPQARVQNVAASAPPAQENTPMADQPAPAPTPAPEPAQAPEPAPAATAPVEVPTVAAAVPLPAIQAAPGVVSVHAEPFPYTFAGYGPSMLRDYVASKEGNEEASARLLRSAQMLAETPAHAVLAGQNPAILAAMTGASIQAAPGSTTVDVSDLAQTLHRPDLWLPVIERMTPLYNAVTKVPLEKPNPFLYPATVSTSGLVTDGTEGTNPTPGTIQTDPITVTPALVNGGYQFTRTLLDSAAPSIDMVAAQAIQEDLARGIEAKVATALATSATTATGAAATGGAILLTYRTQLAAFMAARYQPPTHVLAGNDDYADIVAADDSTGRPLIPPSGATNAVGSASQAAGSLGFYGLEGGIAPAWALPTAANTTYMIRKSDVIAFATPVTSFRFEEKDGPELIDLYFRMYLVVHIVRSAGVRELIHT